MNFGKLAFAAALASGATTAPAAVVSQTFSLNASNFFSYNTSAPPSPYATVSGDFTVQYDRSVSYTGATSIIATNFALPYTGPLKFDYNSATGNFVIGAGPGDTNTVFGAYPDFEFNFNIYAGVSSPISMVYSPGSASGNVTYSSFTGSVGLGVTSPVAAGAVPEPATWAMMIAGFGLVGGTMRRRTTKVAYAA